MNIFLTGEINTGKSTVINQFLSVYTGKTHGYKTIRAKTHADDFFGIYLVDINDEEKHLTVENKAGDCHIDKSLICYKHVFEALGVHMLQGYKNADIIIMDEIGVLEKDCENFKEMIIKCLDSDTPVLGVIKQKNFPFLNSIRARKDVRIIEVDGDNNKVLEKLKGCFVNNTINNC